MALIKFSTPAHAGGVFFCLASDTVQGFSFCPAAYQPRTSVYSGFSAVNAIYTASTSKQFTWLSRSVSVDLTHSSAHNTAATQADYAPPAPRWRAYRQALHLHQYPETAATPDAAQLSAAAYYNKVYKGAAYRKPCQPGGVSSYRVRIAGKCCTRRTC